METRTRAGQAAAPGGARAALVGALACIALAGIAALGAPALAGAAGAPPRPATAAPSPAVPARLATAPGDSFAVWIHFHPAAADGAHLRPALSPDALALRHARGIDLRPDDHPLPPALVERVRAAGGRVRHESRWLRAVSAWVDGATLARIARLPEVRAVSPVALSTAAPHPVARSVPSGASGPPLRPARASAEPIDYGLSTAPLAQLNVPAAHELGFTGAGIRVAILDTGFDPDHESLTALPLLGARDYIGGDGEVRSEAGEPLDAERHGTWIWSLAGARAPGQLVGPAFGASWLLAKVDDVLADPRADEDRWVAALEWADSMGVHVVISATSFRRFDEGFEYPYAMLDGDASVMTQAADRAARRGMLIVTQVGDGGPGDRTLDVPADADSVLSVGAADSAGRPLLFSARGPTADGRLKPELAARGSDVWAASAVDPGEYDRLVLGGTGLATALVGGAAALVWEAWPTFGPMEVREALIRSGGRAHEPESGVGYGVPDVGAAILFPLGFDLTRAEGVDGGGELTTLVPRFHFDAPLQHPLSGQVTYVLELSPDTTFRDILFSRAQVDVSSIRLLTPLRPGTRFYWRVKANTLRGVSTVSAIAGPAIMPAWATLHSPNSSSGSQIETVRPRLVWSALAAPAPLGPLEFDVEIFSNRTGELVQRVEGIRDTSVVVPEPLTYNDAFTWRLIVRSQRVGVADTVRSAGPFVIVGEEAPPATLLYQNFPNPFSDSTRIWFDLRAPTAVELTVHDLRGRLVRRLIPTDGCPSTELPPGLYGRAGLGGGDPCVVTGWDGRDDAGRALPSGVYLLRMRTSDGAQLRRMLLVRP